jgi:hypothetical protein
MRCQRAQRDKCALEPISAVGCDHQRLGMRVMPMVSRQKASRAWIWRSFMKTPVVERPEASARRGPQRGSYLGSTE